MAGRGKTVVRPFPTAIRLSDCYPYFFPKPYVRTLFVSKKTSGGAHLCTSQKEYDDG